MGLFGLLRLLAIAALAYYISRWLRHLFPVQGSPFPGGSTGRGERTPHGARSDAIPRPEPATPYDVLGVSPMASRDEIHQAYQRLIRQYHPDRVAGMGPELQELAERRTKEINAAYAQLKSR